MLGAVLAAILVSPSGVFSLVNRYIHMLIERDCSSSLLVDSVLLFESVIKNTD